MKTKNAPEKIYLFENPITETPDDRWLSKRSDENDIEYTSTDSIIEKAVSYLNSQLYDWVSITNPNQRSCANVIPKINFIMDFKNHMKG